VHGTLVVVAIVAVAMAMVAAAASAMQEIAFPGRAMQCRHVTQNDVAVQWATSVAVWCLGGGGYSGGGNSGGNGNNGSSSDSNTRGCITRTGHNGIRVWDGNEARVHMANNAGAGTMAEQFTCT